MLHSRAASEQPQEDHIQRQELATLQNRYYAIRAKRKATHVDVVLALDLVALDTAGHHAAEAGEQAAIALRTSFYG